MELSSKTNELVSSDDCKSLWKVSDNIITLKLLLEKNVDVNMITIKCNNLTKLNEAANNNNVELVKFLLTIPNIDYNTRSIDYNTPLHLARDLNIIKMLVEAGADINALNKNNSTPMMVNRTDDKIKYLISKGADRTIKNNDNRTIYDIVKNKSVTYNHLKKIEYMSKYLSRKELKEIINYLVSFKIK